jgi:hypothetical protein
LMLRERFKRKHRKNLSTNARHGDGLERSSDEVSVMGMERRSLGQPAKEFSQPIIGRS